MAEEASLLLCSPHVAQRVAGQQKAFLREQNMFAGRSASVRSVGEGNRAPHLYEQHLS